MVNGSARVFIERCGIVEEVSGVTIPEKSLQVAVRNIARALGDEINEEKPLLDSRLPDGSRVAAVIPPCSVNGTRLTFANSTPDSSHPTSSFVSVPSRLRFLRPCTMPSSAGRTS
jgi:pilus assembly protein CpaF